MFAKLVFVPLACAACLSADFLVSPTTDADTLASALLGTGVAPGTAPTLTGEVGQAGLFSGFSTGPYVNPITATTGNISLPGGVILSTGNAVDGASIYDGGASTDFGGLGHPGLSALIGGTETFDAASLSFTVIPNRPKLYLNFLFLSTEYPGSVGTAYNDVFGMFVNGTNVAVVPGTSDPISINTINAGDTFGNTPSNPTYFTQNSEIANTQFNYGGATVLMTAVADVTPGVENTIEFAIADANDSANDSAVLLQAGSLSTESPSSTPEPATYALIGAGLIAFALVRRRFGR